MVIRLTLREAIKDKKLWRAMISQVLKGYKEKEEGSYVVHWTSK